MMNLKKRTVTLRKSQLSLRRKRRKTRRKRNRRRIKKRRKRLSFTSMKTTVMHKKNNLTMTQMENQKKLSSK